MGWSTEPTGPEYRSVVSATCRVYCKCVQFSVRCERDAVVAGTLTPPAVHTSDRRPLGHTSRHPAGFRALSPRPDPFSLGYFEG
ncbi:hypothetical protein MCOR25_008677 [Pyricularia grisea]|nr:hypothetical protein MCOR25_008677 [Pyricularia grisea]